jgi:micrococcal nuclease
MTWPRALPWIVLLVLAGLVLGDVGLRSESADPSLAPGGTAAARLERVVDGDTIAVQLGGRDERVRYIGIDTPETVKPNAPVECFGEAAHDLNARLVGRAGEALTLRFDRELRDRYGRLLAYVYRTRDGLFVNARLLAAGAARTLAIAPNTARAAELSGVERTAQAAGRGLWSAC